MIEKLNLLENIAFDFEKWLTNQSFSLFDLKDYKIYSYYSKKFEFNIYVHLHDEFSCSIYFTTTDIVKITSDFMKFRKNCQDTITYKGKIPSNSTFSETLFAHLLNYEEE